MQKQTIAFVADQELYEALQSAIKDELEENGLKLLMGQMVRKILVTHLRKEGYLTTNKRKMGQEQENGEKSLFDGEGDRSPNNGEGERKE